MSYNSDGRSDGRSRSQSRSHSGSTSRGKSHGKRDGKKSWSMGSSDKSCGKSWGKSSSDKSCGKSWGKNSCSSSGGKHSGGYKVYKSYEDNKSFGYSSKSSKSSKSNTNQNRWTNRIKIVNVMPRELINRNDNKANPAFLNNPRNVAIPTNTANPTANPSNTANPANTTNPLNIANPTNNPSFTNNNRIDPQFNLSANSTISLTIEVGGGGLFPANAASRPAGIRTTRTRNGYTATIRGTYRGTRNNYLILQSLPDRNGKRQLLHINRRYIRLIRVLKTSAAKKRMVRRIK